MTDQTSAADALKPCPFCGGSDNTLYHPNEGVSVITCNGCNAESGYNPGMEDTSDEQAVRFWNTRADQTALDTQKPAWDAERFWRGYPDNKPDNTGLDDGPPLSKSEVRSWKKPLVIKAFQEGLSARACGRVFDVNHETAAQWTSGISRAALAGKPKDGGDVVPGVMHCAKCKFQLIRTNLYFGNGTTGPGDNKTEPCPNGCGPLWPVSWKQQAMELGERLEEVWKENEGLKALTADNAKRGE